jgi:alkylation response protein AidB-like acyl-CoA dehydrogenase
MARNGIGFALSLVNKFAGSEWVDKLGIRKPAEKIAYASTRAGFQIATSASQGLQQVKDILSRPFGLEDTDQPGLFDLSLSEDQILIRESVQSFAKESIRPAAADANDNPDWLNSKRTSAGSIGSTFNALGLIDYAIAESFGGYAQGGYAHGGYAQESPPVSSPVTNIFIAEDLAWGDMGIALSLLSNFSVANLLGRWGTLEQQSVYLPALLGERPLRIALAINEPTPMFNPHQMQTKAIPTDGGYRLAGKKSLITNGMDAELFIIAAALPNGHPRLFIVDAGVAGLQRKLEPAMGLKAAGTTRLKLEDVFIPADACIGNDNFNWRACLDLGALMWCAMAIGTCQAVLDYVVPYCNERKAFGEPISHRQSVAFMIADMATELEGMRLLTYRAAARAEQGMEFGRETYLAKLFCAEKAVRIATDGVQLLGGHGFTREHPVERWYRDLVAVTIQFNTLHA